MDNKYNHAAPLDDDALDDVSGGVASFGPAGSPGGRAILCGKCGGRANTQSGNYYLRGFGTVCKRCYDAAQDEE